jgi:hypothetical protein
MFGRNTCNIWNFYLILTQSFGTSRLIHIYRNPLRATYNNAGEVQRMASEYGFETRAIPMKNTHHAKLDELLIGKDFQWLTCDIL